MDTHDLGERLYSGTSPSTERELTQCLDPLVDAGHFTAAEQQAEVQAFAALKTVQIPDSTIIDLATLDARERLAPASEAEVEARGMEARRRQREQHGAVEAERRVAAARAVIARTPLLQRMVDEAPGLANHERAVQILIDAARRG